MQCDIIVPVYNAIEDVKKCIESIVMHTDLSEVNLIIINDASPDTMVKTYLDSINIQNVKIYNNKSNLGFVGTCNKGMHMSTNDVILLNSDTEVTKNWLVKLKACAYSSASIGTATPFTNNGEICSVPNFLKDNYIPSNMTIDEFAELVENVSSKEYPQLPTGVGFCMYIKREVINTIGYLDQETFGKGYGEENDFCCRAIENGYINVLCDDTFIYHKGSMSFKEEKRQYIEKNLKILGDRYPYYHRRVAEFIQKNSLRKYHEKIRFAIRNTKNKDTVLYIIHNGLTEPINHAIGGTEFHLLDLIQNLHEYRKLVLISSSDRLILFEYDEDEVKKYAFPLKSKLELETFTDRNYERILTSILDVFCVDVLHVQHIINHTFDIYKIASKLDIPIVTTLHDYYFLCPKIKLLDYNNEYCINLRSEEHCWHCIKRAFEYDTHFLNRWKKNSIEILELNSSIFTPSNASKQVISDYYKNIGDKIKVVEHGIVNENLNIRKNLMQDNIVNIAFIGGLSPEKGSGVICDLIINNNNKKIKWHLIGNLGDQRLNLMDRTDVNKYGRYNRNEIVKILNELKIDLVCIFSIWPETYSYTLTEAWMSGIPVLATDIGALGERITTNGGGWKIPLGMKTNDILETIDQIISDEKSFEDKVKEVRSIRFPSVIEMSKTYDNEYRKLIKKRRINNDIQSSIEFIYQGIIMGELMNNATFDEDFLSQVSDELISLREENTSIKQSLGWKVINRLNSKNTFFSKATRRLLHNLARVYYRFM